MLALLLTSSLTVSVQQSYSSQIHKASVVHSQLSKQFFEAHPTAFSGVCSEYQNFYRVVIQKNSFSTDKTIYISLLSTRKQQAGLTKAFLKYLVQGRWLVWNLPKLGQVTSC